MKMANGSGSIVKLSGNRRKPYAVRVTTGWVDGKQQRKYIGFYKDHPEAIVALGEYFKTGYDVDLSKLTLNEVYQQFIKRVEKKDLSVSVMRTHNSAYKRFGELGKKKIKDIKAPQLQDWLDAINLKPSSKGKIRSTMVQVFEYAVKNDIVIKNYAKGLEIHEKVKKTGSIFTDEEIMTLWKHSDDEIVQQILILIYSGMRIGEMLAVHRDVINFDKGFIIGGNKSEAGEDRVIPIHRKIMPFIKMQLGENKWLIQNNRGGSMSYQNASKKINEVFERFGMNHKIHDTRKTGVSLMHSAGIPIETIKIIVGHAGNNVTEKVYLYKMADELVETINKVDIPYC